MTLYAASEYGVGRIIHAATIMMVTKVKLAALMVFAKRLMYFAEEFTEIVVSNLLRFRFRILPPMECNMSRFRQFYQYFQNVLFKLKTIILLLYTSAHFGRRQYCGKGISSVLAYNYSKTIKYKYIFVHEYLH